MKRVVIHFEFSNVSVQQYENVWNDLRKSGQEHPKGLLFHVGAPKPDGGFFVTDIWESEEAFKQFGTTLMPLLEKHDIPQAQPKVYPVQYVYETQEEKLMA